MEARYNAFISYRHHPDDIRVATQIHRLLEHFKVPRAIRSKISPITRLFRDKEELPITSNLTDDIAAALRDSDYLIVICSVHTKESIWVQREIELFLQTHPKNKVLTVLASGEPYDVIPQILLQDEVTDPVTGQKVTIPVEPLSCDWRFHKKKVYQEELPRLAAALLGCRYDELRQRQRQHRIRKLIAAFSACLAASVCLAAYFLYTSITIQNANIQIQKNLEDSLKNQSQYLVTASAESLADGDRLTAIALAMAALPSEEDPRPYVPEAEYALVNALGIYDGGSTLTAVGSVSPGNNILVRKFWVSNDGKIIYLLDQRNCITIWDTFTLEQLGTLNFGDLVPSKLITTTQGTAFVLVDKLYAFLPDGTCLWETEACNDIALLLDESTLLVITQDNRLRWVDPTTGIDVRDPLPLQNAPEAAYFSPDFLQENYAPDSPVILQDREDNICSFLCVDPISGTQNLFVSQVSFPTAACITPAGNLVVMSYDPNSPLTGIIDGTRFNSAMTNTVCCYNTAGILLWAADIVSYTDNGNDSIALIPGSNQLLCQTGSVLQILDSDTGSTISRCEAGSTILNLDVRENSAVAVLQDGYVCVFQYSTNTCMEIKYLERDLTQAEICGAYFGHRRGGTNVTVYRTPQLKNLWSYDWEETLYLRNLVCHGNLFAFSGTDSLVVFDLVSHTPVYQSQQRPKALLGFSNDGSKLYFREEYGVLSILDIATGSTSQQDMPAGEAEEYRFINSNLLLDNDRLYYTASSSQDHLLICWDLDSGEVRQLSCFEDAEDLSFDNRILAVKDDFLWLWSDTGSLYELNLSGSCRILKDGIAKEPSAVTGEDHIAVANLSEVYLLVPGDEEITTITLDNAIAGSLHFYGNQLLILCDDGHLYRYDLSGTLLSQTRMSISNRFLISGSKAPDATDLAWYTTPDGDLVLNAFGLGNIIDCDSWKCMGYVPDFVLYDPDENMFLCSADNRFTAYPRYTLAQLLALAQTQLNGFQLSEEQKLAFGLD